ncbi:MAG: hypothetical protein HQL50_05685 [Magnetococcales bacterium]|nr:hypothetical protein [Magnetococcales bacterium]
MYTFGCPRVGDRQFADLYRDTLGERTYRYVNNNDAVTRLPPAALGYRHVGQLRYIDHRGRIKSEQELTWWDRIKYQILGRLDGFTQGDLFDGMSDHRIEEYLRCLKVDDSHDTLRDLPV